jgi:serine/threonine protein kinase
MTDRELFLLALDISDDGPRQAFLSERCANYPAQRGRVERLLRAYDAAGAFLEKSLDEVVPTIFQPAEHTACLNNNVGAGTVLAGRYTLLRPLGQGGMGVVWAAEQTEPVARLVAAKLIRPGLDSESVVVRFAAERQTLAMMDHPNIAKVFDGGTTEDGRPFVVMELVDGVPITRFCDDNKLPLKQRLELFTAVCQAIHHAHQKGIIHRDLKPSNVLVTIKDDRPVPKIIDFGVAKATNHRLHDHSLYTGLGNVIGTPQYMSPEQAGMNPQDVDTRSDIYSLGVLLYELLTGRLPFETAAEGAIGIVDLLRAIREQEPTRPSDVRPTAAVAAARGTTAAKLALGLRGELDWIAVKCLEKDRNRRYESAHSLSADIWRHLLDEPVTAGPPSKTYRLRKLVRKHRGPMIAVSLVLLVVVGGSIGTTIGMVRAARAEEDAKDQARKAEKRFSLAQAAVDSYLTVITDDKELRRADHHDLRQRLLTNALPFHRRLAEEQPNDPGQLAAQARALGRHADLSREVGDLATAVQSLESAERILAGLQEKHPRIDHRLEQGMIYRRLADLSADRADHLVARKRYDTAVSVLYQLIGQEPDNWAASLELARTFNNCGLWLSNKGDATAAVYYDRALSVVDALAERDPANEEIAEMQSVCRNNLGVLHTSHRDFAAARVCLEKGLAIAEKLVAADPDEPSYVQKLAGTQANLARMIAAEGNPKAARDPMERAAAALKKLAERFPKVPEYRFQWAGVENNAAMLQADTGEPVVALDRHTAVIAALEQYAKQDHPHLPEFLSNCHAGRARALEGLNRQAEASEAWKKAVTHAPASTLAAHQSSYATNLARTGRFAEAVEVARKLEASESGEVLYNAACVYAICHRRTKSTADASRALALLRTAITKGYSDRVFIRNDPDFESLRENDDFRLLITQQQPQSNHADRPTAPIKVS